MARSRANRCRRYKRGDLTFRWCGSRTINVFEHGTEIDVISFGYGSGNERPTAAQARAAIGRRLESYLGED